MLPHNNSRQELLLFLRRSMRMGDVSAVYHALEQSSFPVAKKICTRYEIDLERFEKGEISADNWCLDQIRSFNEILNWPDFLQNQDHLQGELDKKLLLRLVHSFELDKALTICEVVGDSSILMQARYKVFEKMFNQGKIEIASWELIRYATQHQLWELGQSKTSTLNFKLNCHAIYKKWIRRIFK